MNYTPKKRCSGLSIVELLVALAISLVLTSAAVMLFVYTKRAYTETERFSWIQENSRFASMLLSNDLKLALFLGEGRISSSLNPISLDDASPDCTGHAFGSSYGYAAAYTYDVPVTGTTIDASNSAFGCISDGVPGTNVLVVKHAKPTPVTPGSEVGTKTYVVANNTLGYLYDGADGTPTISAHYGGGTLNAWEYQVHIYYIRQADQCSSYDANHHTAPCLARKTLQWNGSNMAMVTEDVVDGVENMQLEFGQDTDGDGGIDTFTKTSGTTGWTNVAWKKVSAVRFSLLLREEKADPYYDASVRTYVIGGTSFTPSSNDHFHRSITQTTVLLRNPEIFIQG